ncbi:MAG TPA: methionyl-tRNA formyltransferase [Gemmatimonadota bacterium]|nr:methionyl-tRNA formyltransferase [Gemmatimonadota bacterium]
MRVVFWGSPDFAVTVLESVLASAHAVVAVVTQPPRPSGRGRRQRPTPVAQLAESEGIEVLAPKRPRGLEFLRAVEALGTEVFLVAAYGAILPPEVLSLPPRGALNVHASLLPAYRGAAPVTRAILDGRRDTGVTIMRMEEGLDTGPICLQEAIPIRSEDTAGTLTARLAGLGGRLAVEALDRLALGTLVETPQDDASASYAAKVATGEAAIDWGRSAAEIERAVRAFDPWPGAWTTWRGERIKVLGAGVVPAEGHGPVEPGTVAAVEPAPVVVAGGDAVRLDHVQPAGGRRMGGADWARGRRVEPGERLGAG